ncbi:MAG: GNAT family N-acetyltransferase [Planctomycetota bacterium]
MIYREATLNDAATVSQFVTELATKHIAPTLTAEGRANLVAGMNVDATRKRIADGWLHVLQVAHDRLLGVVVVRPPSHLYHLFVETEHQRTGIGRALFRIADERTLCDTGFEIKTVNASLNVVEAYIRLGFDASGDVCEIDGIRFQPMVRTGG